MRSAQLKEYFNYAHHPHEVTGTVLPFHYCVEMAQVDGRHLLTAVYILRFGSEHYVAVAQDLRQLIDVGGQVTRVFSQVIRVIELCGVDKYAYYGDIIFCF